MSFAAELQVVNGADRAPLPHGLFSIVNPRPEGDGRWEAGVTWEALSCHAVSGIGPDCTTPIGIPKIFDSGVPIGTAESFVIYGTFKCDPIGRSLDEAQQRARAQLIAREEYRAEQAFWTGDLGNTPNLVTGATTLGTAVSPEDALGRLENWIATNYGSLGVIHVTRGAALALIAAKLLEVAGNTLQTRLGTPVVAGSGYPGTSPAGAAPAAGTSWGFASPAIFGYRSDIFDASERLGDLMDRARNDLYSIAERFYLLGFDPCGTAAVNFNLK